MTRSILIVEDEAIVALHIRQRLEAMGYTVAGHAERGEEAVQLAQKLKPDLVLMDVMLNGQMDGIDAAERITSTLGLPVVYLTAFADDQTLRRAQRTHPSGYLMKPFEDLELKAIIEVSCKAETPSRKQPSVTPLPRELDWPGDGLGVVPTGNAAAFLRQVPFFRTLPTDLLDASAANANFRSLRPKEVLYIEGEAAPIPFIVCTGRMVFVKSSSAGKELIVDFVLPGDPVALYLSSESQPSPIAAKAGVSTTILCFDPREFQRLLQQCEEFRSSLSLLGRARLWSAYEFSHSLAYDSAETRIANVLKSVGSRYPAPITSNGSKNDEIKSVFPMTRQELALLSGVSLETAIRVTRLMEEQGILDLRRRGKIQILNFARL